MPELPEVETIKLGLSKKITGLKITKVEVINPKTFQGEPKIIVRKNVLKVWRKAKVLGVDLTGDLTILFHLKMTGQLILVGNRQQVTGNRFIGGHPTLDMLGELPNKSTRVIFTLKKDSGQARMTNKEDVTLGRSEATTPESYTLYFNDQRKFGWVKIVKVSELMVNSSLKNLGPEPLEKGFTWQILKQNLLRHKSGAVKVVILDQSVVSGIGNIYAAEACFLAKIDPRKRVGELSDTEFKRLHKGIVESLANGIKHGGSSKTHFVNIEGKKGRFLEFAFVYNREGDMCKICGGRISKIKLGGRGTFLCPKCQK